MLSQASQWQMHYFPKLVFSIGEASPFPHPCSKKPNKWITSFFRLLYLWSMQTMHQQFYALHPSNQPLALTSRRARHQLSQWLGNLCSLPETNRGFNNLLTVEPEGMLQRIMLSIILPYLAATLGGTNGKINGIRKKTEEESRLRISSRLTFSKIYQLSLEYLNPREQLKKI